MFKKNKKRLKELEVQVKRLECKHGDWLYSSNRDPMLQFRRHFKFCKHCGEEVGMLREPWLQEQADNYYKLHEHMIDMINKPAPEASSRAGTPIFYIPDNS
jgi:hypothetical protein